MRCETDTTPFTPPGIAVHYNQMVWPPGIAVHYSQMVWPPGIAVHYNQMVWPSLANDWNVFTTLQ